jgi:orotate phosphoribosyltransferase
MGATTNTPTSAISTLMKWQRTLYAGTEIHPRIHNLAREVPHSGIPSWVLQDLLLSSRAMYFDAHVEVVSGHHTGVYLRFESIARFPRLLSVIARDMAEWVATTFRRDPLVGLIAPESDARLLAERLVESLAEVMPLRLVLTAFDRSTGRIGTEIPQGTIREGDRFVSLNDVTTRGTCVSKLGKLITDQGGHLAGMMVFARRDSGQFPLMEELVARYPFYYAADLMMPQWQPEECPLCQSGRPMISLMDITAL